jgi:hypothetical protein
MASTPEILNAMTDRALFERLANEVLRVKFPYLTNLIVGGINPQGETIKGPTDAFCLLSDGRYAMVHHTTSSTDLKGKWLYKGEAKTKEQGDLIKAIRSAEAIRSKDASKSFVVFLVTNQLVNETLHSEIHEANPHEYITIEVVELSTLASFLDFTPEGQYIRKIFLHIEGELLSRKLLSEITELNIERYKQEIFIEDEKLVETSEDHRIYTLLRKSNKSLNLLSGGSGLGKSTVAYNLLKKEATTGRVVIRLAADVLSGAQSMMDAIYAQLKRDYPTIRIDPIIIDPLFGEAFIVIDDINKSENPAALLDKIIFWSVAIQRNDIQIVCPVWPQHFSLLENRALKESKYFVIPLERLEFEDCNNMLIKGLEQLPEPLTPQQRRTIIIDTARDPLLITFCITLLQGIGVYSNEIANEAIKKFVDGKIQKISQTHDYTVVEVKEVIEQLGKCMLMLAKTELSFNDVKQWFGENRSSMDIVKRFASQRQLFYFDDAGTCIFRHDRVKEHFIEMSLSSMLVEGLIDESCFVDPYFGYEIGAAIATSNPKDEQIKKILYANPLAVYASLKYLQQPKDKILHDRIVKTIEEWTKTLKERPPPRSVTRSIAWTLIDCDVRDIERITTGLTQSLEIHLVRLKNGDWLSGVKVLSFYGDFMTRGYNYWLDTIVVQARALHYDKISKGLAGSFPKHFTAEGAYNAFILAGFFEMPELIQPMKLCWEVHKSAKTLLPYLWAVLNCFGSNDIEILREALQYWVEIPEPEKPLKYQSTHPKRSIQQQLSPLRWDFTEEQVAILIKLANDPALTNFILNLLSNHDSKVAFQFVLNHESKSPNIKSIINDRRNDRWKFEKVKQRISSDSLEYLKSIILDLSEDEPKRFLAWKYWSGNEDHAAVMGMAKSIGSDDTALYDECIFYRIINEDLSVVPQMMGTMDRKPFRVGMFYHVWCEETAKYFKTWFADVISREDKDAVTDGLGVLMALNSEEAAEILVDNWDNVRLFHSAITTALYLSTPLTRELARKEIERLGFANFDKYKYYYRHNLNGTFWSSEFETDNTEEEKKNIHRLLQEFQYIEMHYGCTYQGYENRITRKNIESLLPCLPLISSMNLRSFIGDFKNEEDKKWCLDHFFPYLDEHDQRHLQPTKEDVEADLQRMLDDLEKTNEASITHWTENVGKRETTQAVLFDCLASFAANHHSPNAVFLVCSILEHLGTRKDIPFIESLYTDQAEEIGRTERNKSDVIYMIRRKSLQ